MFGYHVPLPNQAMLISGGKTKGGAPFHVVVGHGKFVGPLKKVRLLTLAMQEAEVTEQCVSKQGIPLLVKAVIAFKVGNDDESIIAAGQRFLSDQNQMTTLTGRIFAGHLRSIVGNMTVEEIVTERQKLATEVLDGSKGEMARMGLIVDALQIQSIDDQHSGYLDAMAAPNQAAIQRQAKIAQADADQAAAQAQQDSAQKQVGYKRQTTIAQAEADALISEASQEAERRKVDAVRQTAVAQATAKAEVDAAQAKAAQAGPLSNAEAQKAVLDAQTILAQQNAELKKQQLQADVVKPAEAEAERVVAIATANAKKTTLEADALAAQDRVSIDRMIVDQLPQIVKEAAGGLAGANVTVLNGAEGLTQVVTSLMTQVTAILDVARQFRGETGYTLPQATTDGKLPQKATR